MMDNTIAWMVAKPIQEEHERDMRESAEARELRSILAVGQAGGPDRSPLTALAERIGSAVNRRPSEPSCCPA
ncbi:MAG: hypothetical protein M3P84_05800 [Chloroflexota bacterium]|nr:hypothetical protein [Chloroflexota bacterium]